MRRFTAKLTALFRQLGHRKPVPRKPRLRLQLELLEDRALLSGTTGAVANVGGLAFVDVNNNAVQDVGEVPLPGIVVTLSGTAADGTAVNSTATTTNDGFYNFTNVAAGNYELSASSPAFLGGITVPVTVNGQPVNEPIAFQGLKPEDISLSQFLTTSTSADLPIAGGGSGSTSVGPRANQAPVVSSPIKAVNVAENAANATLNLASNFSDPDITNSEVEIDTSLGAIKVTLFDAQAPQTVANFYDYINSGLYNNDIFHRLTSTSKDGLAVLQGGGFNFQSTPSQLVPVTAFPSVQNEPDFTKRPNTAGTLAMAKTSDPNSATSQFFFNLADNSQSLDNTSNSGGFTVFGAIADSASQAIVNQLSALSTQDQSKAAALPSSEQGVFNEIPLQNYTGTSFPTDTTSANYALITGVKVLSRPEFLTYSIVSNSNPKLVTPTLGTGDNERLTLAYATGQTGTATITVKATDTFGASVTDTFQVNVGLSLSPSTLPAGTVNSAYNQTITANGGTGSVTLAVSNITNAIAGLTVPSSGTNTLAITGTPTASGTETFTVTGTDSSGATTSTNYSITINPAVTLSPGTLPGGTINTAYNQTITASGGSGNLTLTVSNLANALAGLTVPTTGTNTLAITGTPTASGTETFTVTAADAAGDTTSTNYSITINPALTLTPATLPGGTLNAAYSQTITASGGTGDVALAVSNIANAIAGLAVPTSGTNTLVLSGTPTATGTETFTVTATDAAGATTSTDYSIIVSAVLTLSPGSLPGGTINTAYNQTITASGGTGTVTLAVSNTANAIAGLTVPTSGTSTLAITGTPTATGTETFTVTATDASGATTSTNYSITVSDTPGVRTPIADISNLASVTTSSATESGNTVTVTTAAAHEFTVGQMVTIQGMTPSGYNGTFQVLTVPTSTTFTYTNPTALLPASTGGGTATVTSDVLDIAANFSDPGITTSEVQINTSMGPINVTLDDAAAPQTVANFYNYINASLYNNDIFHRLTNVTADGLAVLQGGGFTFETSPSQLVPVTTFPSIQNEPDFTNRSNVAGTIAMAKQTDPNSATSQFFFNLTDNSQALNNTSNSGGFTVFGKIADSASQTVVNELAALPTQNQGTAPGLPASEQGVFNEIPLQNYTGTNFPTDTTASNYALITGVTVVSRPQFLTYSIVSNTNLGLVTATLGAQDNNRLTLAYATGQTGTATITVQATNVNGASVTTSFTVTVS